MIKIQSLMRWDILIGRYIKFYCGFSIVLFIILRLLKFELIDSISYTVAIVAFCCLLYDRWLWRINPFEQTPKIYGKYKALNKSTYNGGIRYNSDIIIKQTLSNINIYEKMRDGVCESITASLYRSGDNGQWFLCYTYLTHPKNSGDDMHYGTTLLCVIDRDTLEGRYFTDRINQTSGSQCLKKVKK